MKKLTLVTTCISFLFAFGCGSAADDATSADTTKVSTASPNETFAVSENDPQESGPALRDAIEALNESSPQVLDANDGNTSDSLGSFINPYERDSDPIVLQEKGQSSWILQLKTSAIDVSDQVTEPKTGFVYLETPLEIWLDEGLPATAVSELDIAVVDAEKKPITRSTDCNLASPLNEEAEASYEAHVLGSLCWEVPKDKLEGLRARISLPSTEGSVHISIQD